MWTYNYRHVKIFILCSDRKRLQKYAMVPWIFFVTHRSVVILLLCCCYCYTMRKSFKVYSQGKNSPESNYSQNSHKFSKMQDAHTRRTGQEDALIRGVLRPASSTSIALDTRPLGGQQAGEVNIYSDAAPRTAYRGFGRTHTRGRIVFPWVCWTLGPRWKVE